MSKRSKRITRRDFLKRSALSAGAALVGGLLEACGRRARIRMPTPAPPSPMPTVAETLTPPTAIPPPSPTATSPPTAVSLPSPTVTPPPTATPVSSTPTSPPVTSIPTPVSEIGRVITANDFVPEQLNIVEAVVVLVNFAGRPERVFDLRQHWDKIFGTDDPIRQLNAYYHENFYGQLELRPVRTPQIGDKGYVEIELPGLPQDYTFGWLIGMETEDIPAVDLNAAQRLMLEIMAHVVQKHPEINYQDKFIFAVLNATGSEYGRGAAGFLPTGGLEPIYDLFIGDVTEEDLPKFSDPKYFRNVGSTKVIGVIGQSGYTFDRYFQDREGHLDEDQFIRGMAVFSIDAPLSCASHDILHGLRRKSAHADPPEGRARAVNCLYNLPLQSRWLVGTPEHGRFDRSINCTPYIGWWDPMGDHLHPRMPREFFCSHPHGMCAFTKLRMGFIPDRCLAIADQDDMTIKLAPLSAPYLPPAGSEAEAIVIKVPLVPSVEKLAHIYLLLEYRRRFGSERGESHPDNFTIDPDYVLGDKRFDPGYNAADPAASRYVNPPTVFVSDEGVLVYLVNERMPEMPGLPYTEWYNFVLALLNPEGNDRRDDLTQAALDAGESLEVDFRHLYPDRGIPLEITVTVTERTKDYAQVHIKRERLA